MGLWSRSPQTGFSPGQEAAIPGLRGLRKSEKLYPVDSVDFTAGCALRSRHFVKIMDCYLCVGGDLRDHKVAETPVFHSELITAHYDANEVLLFGPVCHCQCNFSRRIIRRDNCAGAAPRFLRQNLNQEDQIEPDWSGGTSGPLMGEFPSGCCSYSSWMCWPGSSADEGKAVGQ